MHDDRIIGGTKRRALNLLLSSQAKLHSSEAEGSYKIPPLRSASVAMTDELIFYAGTTMGHGALALAHACQDNKKCAHIFISADDENPTIQKLRQTNAKIYLHPPMPVSKLNEMAMAEAKRQNAIHFPPAFDMPEFEDAMVIALKDFDASPYSEIWTCAVTGTLTRALQRAFPDKAFKTVKVVKAECDLGKSEIFFAPEKYHQIAKNQPPYPSCPHTDAKVWQYVVQNARPNALIWNTAG